VRATRDEIRTRVAQLLTELDTAVDDASLRDDPEFRSAFVAYVESGMRLAQDNSQPGPEVAEHAPVPAGVGARHDRTSRRAPQSTRLCGSPAASSHSRHALTLERRDYRLGRLLVRPRDIELPVVAVAEVHRHVRDHPPLLPIHG